MIELTQAIILCTNIDNYLWTKIILAIVHVKNNKPTTSLKDKNPYKVYFNKSSKLSYLQILEFIVYIFMYKKEENRKLNIKRNIYLV